MRYAALMLIAPILLLTGCQNQTSPSTGPDAPDLATAGAVIHRVSVAGPDLCSAVGWHPGCDGNFSLIALQHADGTVGGQLQDQFSSGGGVHAEIDCLLVDVIPGQAPLLEAWVGGRVTSPADLAGHRILIRARDRGRSQRDVIDAFSTGMVDPEDVAGVSSNCQDKPLITLFRVAEGQVSIR